MPAAVPICERASERADAARARPPDTRFCLSVDVEEYFHCEVFAGCVRPADWAGMMRRAEPFLDRIGELLETTGNRATFFVLGEAAAYLRPSLRNLLMAGHELACHGWGHAHLGRMTAHTLREDLRRATGGMQDAFGISPRGYRAPTFSVMRATRWALDVIAEAGFEYDASVFPIRHDRYGVPDAPTGPFRIVAPSGADLVEFPPLTAQVGPVRVPVGGGGYLRLLPGVVLRNVLRRRRRQNAPAMLYLHPWELDPLQPRLPVSAFSQWRHRVNLHTTDTKLRQLLEQFRFETASTILSSCDRLAMTAFRL